MATLGLALGASACFGALALAARELLDTGPADPAAGPTGDLPLRARLATIAERTLARRGWQAAIDRAIGDAGIELRAGDLGVLVGGASALGVVLGLLAAHPGLVFVSLVGPALLTRLVLARRRDTRRKAFGEQVVQLLPALAGSLRAGHSLVQAVDLAGGDLPAPMGTELRRVAAEVALGRDLVEALEAVAERYGCEDLRWAASAMQIHREVGGDLARVLDRVGDTIRARDHLRRQVRSLTAEGRASAKVLSIMPVALLGLLSLTNPSYLGTFTGSPLGATLLGASLGLAALGALWLRNLTQLEV